MILLPQNLIPTSNHSDVTCSGGVFLLGFNRFGKVDFPLDELGAAVTYDRGTFHLGSWIAEPSTQKHTVVCQSSQSTTQFSTTRD